MSRTRLAAVGGLVAVLLVVALVLALRPRGDPPAPRSTSAARVAEKGGTKEARPGGGPEDEGEGERKGKASGGASDPAAEAAADPFAPTAGPQGNRPVEDLGLPPVDTAAPIEGDLCEALSDERARLQTAEGMIEKLPSKNAQSLGARRLRAMRDRLEKSVARMEKQVAKRKLECAGD